MFLRERRHCGGMSQLRKTVSQPAHLLWNAKPMPSTRSKLPVTSSRRVSWAERQRRGDWGYTVRGYRSCRKPGSSLPSSEAVFHYRLFRCSRQSESPFAVCGRYTALADRTGSRRDRRGYFPLTPPNVNKGDALLLGPTANQWHITIFRDNRRWGRQISWTSGVTVTGIFEII